MQGGGVGVHMVSSSFALPWALPGVTCCSERMLPGFRCHLLVVGLGAKYLICACCLIDQIGVISYYHIGLLGGLNKFICE